MPTTAQVPTPRQLWKRRKSSLFTHPEDKHCAIYNLFVWAAYFAAFCAWMNPEASGLVVEGDSTWMAVGRYVAFTLGAGYLLGWISGVNVGVNFHNHAHRPIFHSEFLNRWFGRFWTLNGGWPSFYWYHSHVVVHHANLLHEKDDWTVPKRRADGRFESLYSYVFLHWPWRYFPHLWKDFTTGRGGSWVPKKALKEGLIFLALWSVPFWAPWAITGEPDFLMGLCLWLWPAWVGNSITMAAGMYVQHAGSVPKSEEHPYSHSNCFTSKFFNLTMFNIGFHIMHHDYEQVHWSVLPSFHDKMKERLIAGGAHVVPYGYYKASSICSSLGRTAEGYEQFVRDQHEDYRSPAREADIEPLLEPAPALRR